MGWKVADMKGVEKFKIKEGFPGGFKLLFEDFRFDVPGEIHVAMKQDKNNEEIASGIYFWVMRWNDCNYAIYMGSSNNLMGRLKNYTAAFQPHSPNNFKIRCFHDFMGQEFSGATLDLYVLSEAIDRKELYRHECGLIVKYHPLMNKLPSLKESRREIQDKFKAFYRDSFIKIMEDAAAEV